MYSNGFSSNLMRILAHCTFISVLSSQVTASHIFQRPISGQSTNATHAIAAITTLQQWYNEETGLWNSTGWWNSANVLTVLADFAASNHALDGVIKDVFENTFKQAQVANVQVSKVMTSNAIESTTQPAGSSNGHEASALAFPGFMNDYYDDEGW